MSRSELGQSGRNSDAQQMLQVGAARQEGTSSPDRPALPPCRDYAAIVFFANNRFETGKKKLQYLSFGDFAFCAELMIQNWTLGAVGEAPTNPGARTSPRPLGLLPHRHFLLQAPSPRHSSSFRAPPQPPLLRVPYPHAPLSAKSPLLLHGLARRSTSPTLWFLFCLVGVPCGG